MSKKFGSYVHDNEWITEWKVSKYGVISGPNREKYGPEITPYLDTFYAVEIAPYVPFTDAYSKHSQRPMIKLFAKCFQSKLTIFVGSSILDIWLGSECASASWKHTKDNVNMLLIL